jgi:hypothetical protein
MGIYSFLVKIKVQHIKKTHKKKIGKWNARKLIFLEGPT